MYEKKLAMGLMNQGEGRAGVKRKYALIILGLIAQWNKRTCITGREQVSIQTRDFPSADDLREPGLHDSRIEQARS
jgi:hypothetical protein